MKSVIDKWRGISLMIRIVIGLVIGAGLGLIAPNFTVVTIFGTLFVGALKAIAPILVAVLVMSAIAKAGSGVGDRFKTVVGLYLLTTFLSAAVAVAGTFLFPIDMILSDTTTGNPPSGIAQVLTNLLANMVSNPISAVANANYVGVLFWSIVLGLGLKKLQLHDTIKVVSDLADVAALVVGWIIQFAPFGIMGLVFDSVSTSGLAIFTSYGKLLVVLVGCMLFMALVVDPLIIALLLKRNPYPLVFKCLKESGVTAFFTRSSAANIPVNMDLCERLGLERDFYSISIPLGATINMNGAAVTITVMTLAATHTLGIAVDIPTAIFLSVLATLGACGASGVAGGSLLLIPMACSLFGIGNDVAMQVVAVGFIIGVIQDSVETALNSAGDVMFTATAEFYDWKKQGKDFKF